MFTGLIQALGRIPRPAPPRGAVRPPLDLATPHLPDLHAIRTVCAAVSRPANVVAGPSPRQYTVAELKAAGVKRISVGGSFARAALGGLARAAREVLERGTFTYASEAMPGNEAKSYMADEPR